MRCPYCGVETKVSSARFCSACRTAFWDLTSTGACPPVPATDMPAFRPNGPRVRNKAFLAAQILGVVALVGALYAPAIADAPMRMEDYLNIHLGLLLLCSLVAWSNSNWSVIVSFGVGFAVTLALNIGESGLRGHSDRDPPMAGPSHRGPALSTLVHRNPGPSQNPPSGGRTHPADHNS